MSERSLAAIMYQFELTIGSLKDGTENIETLEKEWSTLKLRVGSSIARYCDDFSTTEYWKELDRQKETRMLTSKEKNGQVKPPTQESTKNRKPHLKPKKKGTTS